MRGKQALAMLLLGGLLGGGLAGCERDGPAERAGEKLDEAGKDVQQGVENAADKIEDGAENLQDKVQDGK
jgi:hypothetical protein